MSNNSWEKEFAAYASMQDKAAAERIKKTITNEPKMEKEQKIHPFSWKIGILVATFLLLISGTVLAVTTLRHPDHQIDQYLNTTPEKRDEIPEISEAIRGAEARIESFSVELLGEYKGGYNAAEDSFNSEIPTKRTENGFPEWDPNDYEFLRDMVAGKCEVYYDGSRLYINSSIHTAYAPCFLKTWGYDFSQEHNLDMSLLDCSAEVNGRDCTEMIHSGGWSTGTMMTFRGKPETELVNTDELWMSTDFDDLSSPLEDGTCLVTLQYYIYDCDVDDMSPLGNVARVLYTIAFDTTEGNRGETEYSKTEMSGNMILTVFENSNKKNCTQISNRTVSLSGLTLLTQTQYTAGGAVVDIIASTLPEGWNEDMLLSFFKQLECGITFDLYVNRDYVKSAPLSSSGFECRMELPILPSDYVSITDIRLVPHLGYLKYVDLCTEVQNPDDFETEKYEKRELILDAEPLEGHFMWETEDAIRQDMPGCEIILPLPKL